MTVTWSFSVRHFYHAISCVYVRVWINQHNTKWFTIPSKSACCSQHRPEKPEATRLCSDRFFSCFSLQKRNKWFAICMQAHFVHSEPRGLSLHGMGLVLYHVDLSCKIDAGRFLVSIQYVQGKHLLSSFPRSTELLHRTRQQSDFLVGDTTIHQVSFINQDTKMMKNATWSVSDQWTEHLFLSADKKGNVRPNWSDLHYFKSYAVGLHEL